MKNTVIKILAALLMLAVVVAAPSCGVAASSSAAVASVDEYGNVYLDLPAESLYKAGFAVGDFVTVTVGDTSLDMPIVTAYADVDAGEPLLRDASGQLRLCVNKGSFAETCGCAVGDAVTFAMKTKEGYLAEYRLRNPVYTADRAPDYSTEAGWAYYGIGDAEREFDLFIVAPTVDLGTSGNANMSLDDEKQLERLVDALNKQRGIYEDVCALWSPYYRQETLTAAQNNDADAFELAYGDVAAAFEYYLANLDDGEPIVISGFSQGADMALRLLKEYGDKIEGRTVAAYLLGCKITENDLGDYVKPATGESDTGVFISFNSEDAAVTESFFVGANEKTISINPLNWTTFYAPEPADKSLNMGACFPDGDGVIENEIPSFTGAVIDEVRGTLKVTDVDPAEYAPSLPILSEGVYHLYDYQFFYRNLQNNVMTRCAAYSEANG